MPLSGGAWRPFRTLSMVRSGAQRRRLIVLLASCVGTAASPALAADTGRSTDAAEASVLVAAAQAAPPATPFPADIRPSFRLIDQFGRQVSEVDFAGRPMAVFFGYAGCQAICSVALPRLGAALDLLGGRAAGLAPIVITVDPARDTPEAMRSALPKWHPRLIGLTGTEAALAEARASFQVEARQIFDGPEGPVYAHGSFIYLFGPDGRLLALLPPILGPERMAEIIAGHL